MSRIIQMHCENLQTPTSSTWGNWIIQECVRLQKHEECSSSVLLVGTHCKFNFKAHTAEKQCPSSGFLQTQCQQLPNRFCPHSQAHSNSPSLSAVTVSSPPPTDWTPSVPHTERINCYCSLSVFHGCFARAARPAYDVCVPWDTPSGSITAPHVTYYSFAKSNVCRWVKQSLNTIHTDALRQLTRTLATKYVYWTHSEM